MQNDDEGINYVCRYRLRRMFRKYIAKQRRKNTREYLRKTLEQYDEYYLWHKKFGKYRDYD